VPGADLAGICYQPDAGHALELRKRLPAAEGGVVTPHPAAADGSLVRFESFGHAIDHAKVAAATLTGAPAVYDSVPWFWSD
jgi:hypothetical protein